MRETKLVLLSVHHRYPELLADQARRLARCAGPTRRTTGLRLAYFPIVHPLSTPAVVEAAVTACRSVAGAACLDVRERLADLRCKPSLFHGESLAAAFAMLSESRDLTADDLLVLLDHDTHPLAVDVFAVLACRLAEGGLAAIGIPQWHRGSCYLHPSLLMTRVGTITEMGTDMAFKVGPAGDEGEGEWHDTAEGLTLWCEQRGRPRLALRVNASLFPWARWHRDPVPGGGAELVGEHGEQVRAGNLMHYGLEAGRSLLSHMWGAARSAIWYGLGGDAPRRIFSAYLDEPLLA